MDISFICDIDNINNIPQNLVYDDDLYEYCNFSINIQIEDIELSFSSDVMIIDNESIQNFVYKFENNQPSSMTFNSWNGSFIEFKISNELIFHVYTYKEGSLTTISHKIKVNNNNHNKIRNVFRQLLDFKINFDNIRIIDEDEDYSEDDQGEDQGDIQNVYQNEESKDGNNQ